MCLDELLAGDIGGSLEAPAAWGVQAGQLTSLERDRAEEDSGGSPRWSCAFW